MAVTLDEGKWNLEVGDIPDRTPVHTKVAFTIDTYLVEFLVMGGFIGLLTGKSADGVKKVAGEFLPKSKIIC